MRTMSLIATIRSALGMAADEPTETDSDSGDEFDVSSFRDELRAEHETKSAQGREFPLVPEAALTLGVFPRDNTWGNKVKPTDTDGNGRINSVRGHATVMTDAMKDIAADPNVTFNNGRPVQTGDTFAYSTESGRKQVYVITSVRHADDPDDLFWADVAGVGYVKGSL